MPKHWCVALLASGVFVLAIHAGSPDLTSQNSGTASDANSARVVLHGHRTSDFDLEVGGELTGQPRSTTRYISREELLKLPQVAYTVSDDANFKGAVQISGVLLESLRAALDPSPGADLVVAICADGYRAHFPAEYLHTHHPLLVLKINSKSPPEWPKDGQGHGAYIGPFLISHAKFTPAFKILAHEDEAQIPWGVVRLEFRDERKVFGTIAPRGPQANDDNVKAGFRIAQQNCFRCHNMGEEGGKKSGTPWLVLAAWAVASPEHFISYVRNPQANNPNSQMAPSPQYDDTTMKALIAYFKTFISREKLRRHAFEAPCESREWNPLRASATWRHTGSRKDRAYTVMLRDASKSLPKHAAALHLPDFSL